MLSAARPFDARLLRQYLEWYVPRTRVFLIRRADEDIPQVVTPTGVYPLHADEERHAAVSGTTCNSHFSLLRC